MIIVVSTAATIVHWVDDSSQRKMLPKRYYNFDLFMTQNEFPGCILSAELLYLDVMAAHA